MDQISVTLLGTAVIVALGELSGNSRISELISRLSDTNDRIDAAPHNITALLQAESAKLQAVIDRMDRTLDSRLSRIEAKLGIG